MNKQKTKNSYYVAFISKVKLLAGETILQKLIFVLSILTVIATSFNFNNSQNNVLPSSLVFNVQSSHSVGANYIVRMLK